MKIVTWVRHRVLRIAFGLLAAMGHVHAQQLILPSSPANSGFADILAGYDRELAVLAYQPESPIVIYRRYEDGWRLAQPLAIEPGVTQIGYAMAMGNQWLAVASRTDGFSDARNYIDMYRRGAQGWTFLQRLDAPLDYNGNGFLRTMSLSDTALVVGHWYKVPYTYPRVFVFGREGEGWGAPYVLTPPPGSSEVFGTEISVSDEILAVSDPGRGGTGAVVSFAWDGAAWRESGVMGSPNPADGRRLGRHVAACGRAVIAHMVGDWNGSPPFDRSSVLIFAGGPHAWRLSAEVFAPDDADSSFGQQLACSETTLAIPFAAPLDRQVYATSLYAPFLQTLEVTTKPLPAGSLCGELVVSRGDVVCSSSIRSDAPPLEAGWSGAIYAFNDAGDALLVHGFE